MPSFFFHIAFDLDAPTAVTQEYKQSNSIFTTGNSTTQSSRVLNDTGRTPLHLKASKPTSAEGEHLHLNKRLRGSEAQRSEAEELQRPDRSRLPERPRATSTKVGDKLEGAEKVESSIPTKDDHKRSSPRADWRYGKIDVQRIDMRPSRKSEAQHHKPPAVKKEDDDDNDTHHDTEVKIATTALTSNPTSTSLPSTTAPAPSSIASDHPTPATTAAAATHLSHGIGAGPNGLATKGRFEPSDVEDEELGWGVVRLYRDAEETPGLYDEVGPVKAGRHGSRLLQEGGHNNKKGGSSGIRSGDTVASGEGGRESQGGRGGDQRGASYAGGDSTMMTSSSSTTGERGPFNDEDCTTLCILAVPSYMTPSDFLGFVGERTREEVSHFRMIRTERSNRYMVLMKFRNGRKAREWRKEWNGKAFNDMESENAHVVFVKSIEFRTPASESPSSPSFPDMTNDPFTPSRKAATAVISPTSTATATLRATKPKPPPTPALIELPTCPVCLERMDESTGLLTILCQHVFHCSCIQKWRGSGCPVCRYTHKGPHPYLPGTLSSTTHPSANGTDKTDFITFEDGNDGGGGGGVPGSALNECSICRSDANLWICLICGTVGCGRYDAAHAFMHYQQSNHCFAMDLLTQRIWDYASDAYVHRIVQDRTDGKLVEVTGTTSSNNGVDSFAGGAGYASLTGAETDAYWVDEDAEWVPRAKLDNIGREYTALLTSQLESQRMYFEMQLKLAANKTSEAVSSASKASASASNAETELVTLSSTHAQLTQRTIPELEKERDRATRRAEKFEGMARKLEKEWREEKALGQSLYERVEFLAKEIEALKGRVDERDREVAELKEENRDLGFFISGGQKLRESGALLGGDEEVREGTVSLPPPVVPPPTTAGSKGKGKGKGGKK
ncbi:hypothetical protein MMC25_007055 [Agyrium rufum]|nr:hypothetical protein [Agyrium rufum]